MLIVGSCGPELVKEKEELAEVLILTGDWGNNSIGITVLELRELLNYREVLGIICNISTSLWHSIKNLPREKKSGLICHPWTLYHGSGPRKPQNFILGQAGLPRLRQN